MIDKGYQGANSQKPAPIGMRGTLSNNPVRPYIFEKETIASLKELGKVLQRIHNRMTAEGYEIFEGQVRKKLL